MKIMVSVTKTGNYPNSFWEHIIVCFNTIRKLKDLLGDEEVEWIYSQWQPYPQTVEMIRDNYDTIEAELKKFDMIDE